MPEVSAVDDLLETMRAAGISYCHWKSNEHLRNGLLGYTDLDILVQRDAALFRALGETGFKRFSAVPARSYPGIEDYLAMDEQTGVLVHLHLHYQLTLGEKHLKGYRIPWENLVLSTRKLDELENMYIADPNVELMLLVTRMAIKIRGRDRLLSLVGRRYFRDSEVKEFHWLKQRLQRERLVDIAQENLEERPAHLLLDIVGSRQPSLHQLLAFRRSMKPMMQLYKTYGAVGARCRRWIREFLWLCSAVDKKYMHSTNPGSRVSPRGGLLIAFVGCDGSGKSTLAKKVASWLSWKVDVVPIYFGSGNGSSSLFRWPLKWVLNLSHKISGSLKDSCVPPDSPRGHSRATWWLQWLKHVGRVPWALLLSYEKRRKFRKTVRARNRGMIVICDRYPQNQVAGFNDGPLLANWVDRRSRFLRTIAQWEGIPYRAAETYPPDLVIKLEVTPKVALQRKPDMCIEEIRRRVETVRGLRYPTATRTVVVDADEPMDRVLLKIKQVIWECI